MSREPEPDMDPERWHKVQELFDEVLERSPDQRAEFLDAECDDDVALRREVESMLMNFSAAGSTFMESPAARLGDDLEMPEFPSASEGQLNPGDRVGPYVLERLLGTGGVGHVYLATRETEFHKEVAVKLLKRGMDTDELVRRFVSERQILAQLEHPNVAKLLDGGATEDGRHYLVMEYVEGIPIDRYCSRENLNVRQRIELFLKICDAVHFAHRNLVVHRDLKPSNILVGKDDEPKLLDFGIAKLLRPESFPQTVLPTAPGWRAMTPEYASPEQVRGGLITTASDVYSLAVVLYQLLTGRRPYRLESRSLIDVEKAVCTVQPLRPSRAVTRLEKSDDKASSTETYQGIDRKKLKQRLSGDLDNILLMALEKEPEKRYQSVDQLAADLRRHLDNLPVLARKDSLFYRGSKFIRRHRIPLAVAGVVSLMLLAFVVTLVVQQGLTVRQRDRAESVSDFLENLFQVSDPSRERGESVLARTLLDQGAIDIEARLGDQPGLQGDLLGTMGRSYTNLGLYSEAEEVLQRSLVLRLKGYGADDPAVAMAKYQLADLHLAKGNFRQAEQLAQEAYEQRRQQFSDGHKAVVESRLLLARVHQRLGNMTQSDQLFAQIDQQARDLQDDDFLIEVLLRRGYHESYASRDAASRDLLEEALISARRAYGEIHPQVAFILGDLASLERKHDFDRASRLYEEAIAIQRQVYREPHPDLASMLNNYALLKKARGDYAAAQELFEEVQAIQRRVYVETSIIHALTLNNVASLKAAQGEYDLAEDFYLRSLQVHRREFGERHPRTASVLNNLANLMLSTGRLDEADELYQQSLEIVVEVHGPEHLNAATGYNNLAEVATKRGDFVRAEELYQHSAEILRRLSPEHSELSKILLNHAGMERDRGNREAAEKLYLEALNIAISTQGEDSLTVGQIMANLTLLFHRHKEYRQAEDWARQALAVYEARQEPGSKDRLDARRVLAIVLRNSDRFEEAEALFLQNVEACRQKHAADLEPCDRYLMSLAVFYRKWNKPQEQQRIEAQMTTN